MQSVNFSRPASPAFGGSYLIENIGTKNPVDATYNMSLRFLREANFYEDNEDWYNMKMTVVCDEKHDKKIETYLVNKGIEFRKYRKSELYGPEEICDRMIKDPHYDHGTLKRVDLKKLMKLWKATDPGMFIGPNEEDEQQKNVKTFIKSGQKIHAPTICLLENKNGPQLSVYDGRHRLATLSGMGMDEIKVTFLGQESIDIAEKYGIIKK